MQGGQVTVKYIQVFFFSSDPICYLLLELNFRSETRQYEVGRGVLSLSTLTSLTSLKVSGIF